MIQDRRDERHDCPAPGIERRTALTAAWSLPVVMAAVSAPGAAASMTSIPLATAPVEGPDAGPFVGVYLAQSKLHADEVQIQMRVGRAGGSRVGLRSTVKVSFTSDHDVLEWPRGFVVDGSRDAHFTAGPGAYPSVLSVPQKDGPVLQVGELNTDGRVIVAPLPWGRVTMTGTVSLGPRYLGTDFNVIRLIGGPSYTLVFDL